MDLDPSLLNPSSFLGYILIFTSGILTSIGPCNIAMIPLIVGYVGGSHQLPRWKAFTISTVFSIGLAVTFMLLGVSASLIGGMLGGSMRIWYYLVAIVCFVIGLQMLQVIHLSPPPWLERLQERVKTKGLFGAFLIGLVSGLVSSQCATPALAAILTYVMAQKQSLFYGAVLLFIYALGRGIPIILAGTFTGVVKNLHALGKWSGWLEKASGVVIIMVGFYFLWIS